MRTSVLSCGIVLASLALISCGGGNSPVGKWTGKTEVPKDQANAQLAQGLANAVTMDLEILEDKKFKMSVMGFPVEGSYTQTGKTLTLTPEKSMGVAMPASQKDSLVAIMSDDGKTMSITDKAKGPAMTFTRNESK